MNLRSRLNLLLLSLNLKRQRLIKPRKNQKILIKTQMKMSYHLSPEGSIDYGNIGKESLEDQEGKTIVLTHHQDRRSKALEKKSSATSGMSQVIRRMNVQS